MWQSQRFAVFQDNRKCAEEANERDSLSNGVKPAVQTSHFYQGGKLYLRSIYCPSNSASTVSSNDFHLAWMHFFRFEATVHLNSDSHDSLVQFRPGHGAFPWAVSLPLFVFFALLWTSALTMVFDKLPPLSSISMLSTASDSLKPSSANFRRATPTDGWT